MKWVDQLYKDTKSIWEIHGSDSKGYAIFYSPVKLKPALAVIGYNPGGNETSFDSENINIPVEHDYFGTEPYKLAVKMRTIFKTINMENVLRESVKFNLIFFRSKAANDINDKILIEYCKNQVASILNQIQPRNIISEGFTTYNHLKSIVGIKKEKLIKSERTGKPLVVIGISSHDIPILGLKHPSGARGISNNDLEEMGRLIKEYIKL